MKNNISLQTTGQEISFIDGLQLERLLTYLAALHHRQNRIIAFKSSRSRS